MDDSKLASNPFAALFPSVDKAREFSSTTFTDKQPESGNHPTSVAISTTGQEPLLTGKETSPAVLSPDHIEVNKLIENVFLITLNKGDGFGGRRPPRCVYMQELQESLKQTWLDLDCLEQAVFERLMLPSPGDEVINTTGNYGPSPREASEAGEAEHLRYLYYCYKRARQQRASGVKKVTPSVLTQCETVILNNSRMCLQHPDFFAGLNACQQFIDIFTDDGDDMFPFFEVVAMEIHKNSDEGSVLDAFKPALDSIKEKFNKELTLGSSHLLVYTNLLLFFTRKTCLAEALLAFLSPRPSQVGSGRAYESTLLGAVLTISCVVKNEAGPYEFFDQPSRVPKQEHDIAESNIHGQVGMLNEAVYQLVYGLLKLGGEPRHLMLSWLGNCLHANAGRGKMWSRQLPGIFNMGYASDGFFINLCAVLLRLCKPFSELHSPKLLKIQMSYCQASSGDPTQCAERNIHMKDLADQTCLIPKPETSTETVPLEDKYNFMTECFFMTHQAIHLGLHVVHEKFQKLYQELHKVQNLYQDIVRQGGQDSDTGQRVKQQMEKGMTLFLCLKAALTEPQLLDLCFNFHTSTATYVTHLATAPDLTKFSEVILPLAPEAPVCLTCLPEMLVENILDFMIFIRRFKDNLFEAHGDHLGDFMTLVQVFLGSPSHMRNPHLRARLAEALECLMPPKDPGMTSRIIVNFYREQLFHKHPLVDFISETLLHVFVSIEMTGQGVEFEQKFNYRRPMYSILEYIWSIDHHQDALKRLSVYAEEHIEDTNPPLFLSFINLLVNDAIFLLDEALSYMSQIKEKQAEQENGAWTAMSTNQRQENEANLRQLGMLARFHNIMGNDTIHSLELLTQRIKTIFTHNVLVERVTAMLNYFLLHLVGPKKKNLKVKDFSEYDFKPQELVSNISQIYLNLGEDDAFCLAVCRDGRSYSHELFVQAGKVLQRIHKPSNMIMQFMELGAKIKAFSSQQEAEEEAIADAPDEYLDPIMGTLMSDPVLLPASGQIVDRSTIARHILSDQSDPFNRTPLTMDMVKPADELRQQIKDWRKSLQL